MITKVHINPRVINTWRTRNGRGGVIDRDILSLCDRGYVSYEIIGKEPLGMVHVVYFPLLIMGHGK